MSLGPEQDWDVSVEYSVADMRIWALDEIRFVTGAPSRRLPGGAQSYVSSGGRRFHLSTRSRDETNDGWDIFWFGIMDRYWQPDEFFVLVCGIEFILVVPTNEWIPYQDRLPVSAPGTPRQSRQPHIHWRDEECLLREGRRGLNPLTLDVSQFVGAYHLLA